MRFPERGLLIVDANVLIDVAVGNLLDEMFSFGYVFSLPDILFEIELKEHHPNLQDKGLQLIPREGAAVEKANALYARHRTLGVSIHDCMVLELAKQESCPLLTGDAVLRKVSGLEGVEIRGTLWLMEELVESGWISFDRMVQAYGAMRKKSRRLPWAKVDEQIRKFGEK